MRRYWPLIVGVGALIVLTLANLRPWLSVHAQVPLLIVGAVGVGWWGRHPNGQGYLRSPAPLHLTDVVAMTVLFVLALGVRLYTLGSATNNFVDEVHFAGAVAKLLNPPAVDLPPYSEHIRLLTPFNFTAASTWSFPYLQAGAVAAFGRTLFGLRFAGAVVGALTVPAIYVLAREVVVWWQGGRGSLRSPAPLRVLPVTAALLLATFPPHLQFSRLAFYNIADPLFGVLALTFISRALGGGRGWAVAGVLLGFTHFFYEGGRLLFTPLVLLWMLLLLRTGHLMLSRWREWVALPIATALIAGPVYITLVGTGERLLPRLGAKAVPDDFWQRLLLANTRDGSLLEFARHYTDPFLLYVAVPDSSFYYGGDHPLLLLPLALPFLVGFGWALWGLLRVLRAAWHRKNTASAPDTIGALLALWVLATSAGNTLLENSAWASQYVVVFPALMLTTALGLVLPLAWVVGRGSSHSPVPLRAVTMLPVLIAIVFGVMQARFYYGPQLTAFNYDLRVNHRDPDVSDVMLRAAELPPDSHVHMLGFISFYDSDRDNMLAFLNRQDLTVDVVLWPHWLTQDYFEALPRDVTNAFFIAPGNPSWLNLVSAQVPVLGPPSPTPHTDVPWLRAFVLYIVPAE